MNHYYRYVDKARALLERSSVHRERFNRWLAALRSGDYKQTVKRLHRPDGFCCLGVACDLFNSDGWDVDLNWGTDAFSDQTLPEDVSRWLFDLWEADPVVYIKHSDEWMSLTSLNDGQGYTFEQIADALEETYLGGDA